MMPLDPFFTSKAKPKRRKRSAYMLMCLKQKQKRDAKMLKMFVPPALDQHLRK